MRRPRTLAPCLLAGLLFMLQTAVARGQAGIVIDSSGMDDPANDPAEPGEDALPPRDAAKQVPCLDDLSEDGDPRKGVQLRPFLKFHRLELSAVGGLYASDALSSSYTAGGALAFYPAEDFGLELLVTHAPVNFKLQDPYQAFDGSVRFNNGSANQAIVSMLFSPFHAKFKLSESWIVPGDFFLIGGAGRTFHESVQGLTFAAGFGLKIYLWKYISLRIDVRDYILPQEVLGQGHITNNLAVTGGVSGWLF
jgi:outer membrane beta-barrel protein